MIYTDQGTRVPWDWCPLAFANGIEWGAQGHRYERLYRPLYSWTAPICWLLYLCGFIVGLFWNPTWTRKPKHSVFEPTGRSLSKMDAIDREREGGDDDEFYP